MTAPITHSDFEAFIPYGAAYSPIAGSSTMKTNSTNQHVDGYNLALEPGPVSVSATWTGEEQCDLYLSRTGAELLRLSSIERKAGGGALRGNSPIRSPRGRQSLSLHPRRLGRNRQTHRFNHRHPNHVLARRAVA